MISRTPSKDLQIKETREGLKPPQLLLLLSSVPVYNRQPEKIYTNHKLRLFPYGLNEEVNRVLIVRRQYTFPLLFLEGILS